jgi:hypothetical protein
MGRVKVVLKEGGEVEVREPSIRGLGRILAALPDEDALARLIALAMQFGMEEGEETATSAKAKALGLLTGLKPVGKSAETMAEALLAEAIWVNGEKVKGEVIGEWPASEAVKVLGILLTPEVFGELWTELKNAFSPILQRAKVLSAKQSSGAD